MSAAVEKPSKTDDFRHFWPGLTDGAADCSAPCGPIGLQLLRSRTLTQPDELRIICGHTLARLPRKISARLAHRGPSNRPRRRSTRAKKGENHRFLMVFQLLRSRTSTHPNQIQIICGHTLAHLLHKISARSVHRGPSNRPWHGATYVILGRSREHERRKE